ncbi:MAG: hypothetical protein ACFB9M_02670 [Myxococcota bacterium]
MPKTQRPFVAIVGGFFKLDDDDPQAGREARKAAEQIGAELAKAGFGLVVYFSNDKSLEPHVVSGYVAQTPQGSAKDSIRIRCAHSQRTTGGADPDDENTVYFKEEAARDELFDGRGIAGADWAAPFYRSLAEEHGSDQGGVDAILLMAGGHSTSIAGQVAVGRQLPALAIDAYAGTAKTIWNELKTRSPEYPDFGRQGAQECVEWLRRACDAHLARKRKRHEAEHILAELNSQSTKRNWALVPAVLMFLSLLLGITGEFDRPLYLMLMMFGLLFAGGTGALAGSLLWARQGTAPSTALFLGTLAGVLAGLAYVVPQWISGVDAEAARGPETVSLADKIQFVTAVLVAFTAGIGFDTVFARYKTQAADLYLGVTPGGAGQAG